MIYSWKDRISDWNPQLMRELKGRLKLKTVLMAIGLSLLAQFLIFSSFYGQLPFDSQDYSRYCFHISEMDYNCQKNAAGFPIIHWELWWTDLFRMLNWILPYALMAPATFMLAANLSQEEQSGTLNFIRLSPQTARSILLGKLLGVPMLVYIGVALCLPLHVLSGLSAHHSPGLLISFYTVLLVGSFFIFSAALLLGFLGRTQRGATVLPQSGAIGFVGALITTMFFIPAYMFWNGETVWNTSTDVMIGRSALVGRWQWFYLPLSDNPILAHLFTLGNVAFLTYALWQVLDRCFHTPNATMISKGQSYALVTYGTLLMVGLCVNSNYPGDRSVYIPQVGTVLVITTLGFFGLIAMLSNHRQSLLDWARYRHVQTQHRQIDGVDEGAVNRRSLWQDLVWGERSPATVAILINLGIVAVITLPWMLFLSKQADVPRMVLGLLINLSLIALYAAIAQLILLSKNSKRSALAFSCVGLLFLVPLFLAVVINGGGNSNEANTLFVVTPVVWAAIYNVIPIPTLLFSLLGQWSALVLLNIKFTSQLRQLGASDSQALFVRS